MERDFKYVTLSVLKWNAALPLIRVRSRSEAWTRHEGRGPGTNADLMICYTFTLHICQKRESELVRVEKKWNPLIRKELFTNILLYHIIFQCGQKMLFPRIILLQLHTLPKRSFSLFCNRFWILGHMSTCRESQMKFWIGSLPAIYSQN